MKYAVEARMFKNGLMVAKVRPALPEEPDSRQETNTCEIWVDVFDTEMEARGFLREYRKV